MNEIYIMLHIFVLQNQVKSLDAILRRKYPGTNPPAGLSPVLAVGVAAAVLVSQRQRDKVLPLWRIHL